MVAFNYLAASFRRWDIVRPGIRRRRATTHPDDHLRPKNNAVCAFVICKWGRDAILPKSPSLRLKNHSTTSIQSTSANDDSINLTPTLASVKEALRRKVGAAQQDYISTNSSAPYTNPIANDRSPPRNSIFIDGLAAARLGIDPRRNTRHAPMVYHERYSCPNWPVGHTFPMAKFEHTALSLLNDFDEFLRNDKNDDVDDNANIADENNRLVLSRDHFFTPLPVEELPRCFLSPPIRSDFLDDFLSGSLSAEDCRIIGFREQTSRPELIERTMLEVAGTVLTAQLAMRFGLASNLAGGTHHAESHRGKGFTIINDLAVAARLMTWGGWDVDESCGSPDVEILRQSYRGGDRAVDRVLVVDCDVHQGDGTATFSGPPKGADVACRENSLHERLFTLDLHAANNYPHPKENCTYDIGLLDDCDDDTYLSELEKSLDRALMEVIPQLVLYNAGVDVFVSDKLGRLSLSYEGMRRRDSHVIRTCLDRGIPVAAVVGGGYDNDEINVEMHSVGSQDEETDDNSESGIVSEITTISRPVEPNRQGSYLFCQRSLIKIFLTACLIIVACLSAVVIVRDRVAPSGSARGADEGNVVSVDSRPSEGKIVEFMNGLPLASSVDRFEYLTASGFWSDVRVFRIVPNFVSQFGISSYPDVQRGWSDIGPISDDPVVASNVRGTVTFATSGQNTRTTQIFINMDDNVYLDGQGFAPIGEVLPPGAGYGGMEVVNEFYSGYGERPEQGKIEKEGGDYLNQEFPLLSYFVKADFVEELW
ncbi:hypothetical protein ACHAXA_008194 [Cyclostephanos tholiformis]|uniref:PPIase cyclophilin-type domain-containing protein n=1 Tax=Cyclostephanos tholiformis TaxID=382380 RepID=A0ABD3SCY8_9STRA